MRMVSLAIKESSEHVGTMQYVTQEACEASDRSKDGVFASFFTGLYRGSCSFLFQNVLTCEIKHTAKLEYVLSLLQKAMLRGTSHHLVSLFTVCLCIFNARRTSKNIGRWTAVRFGFITSKLSAHDLSSELVVGLLYVRFLVHGYKGTVSTFTSCAVKELQ
jgi:hypothetical protein